MTVLFIPLRVFHDDRKEFGLDSFISPTLLGNMREKDLRKAISYHLKKIQSLLEPRQKVDIRWTSGRKY